MKRLPLLALSVLLSTSSACFFNTDGPTCGPGTVEDNGECLPSSTSNPVTCAQGTTLQGNSCVPDSPDNPMCGEGTTLQGNTCVSTVACGIGTTLDEGFCLVDDNPGSPCGPGTMMQNGMCVAATRYNVYSPFQQGFDAKIGQGYHGNFSHNGKQVYAVDFPLDEGTPVVAVLDGTVIQTREDSNSGCADSSCGNDANYVVVDHGNSVFSRYLHLQQNSVEVTPGQTVCRGELLARTGNTGWSTDPHLHLELSDAFQYTLPLTFEELKTNTNPGVPASEMILRSQNTATSNCTPPPISTCPEEIFAHRGILLDPGAPCSLAEKGKDYTISGVNLLETPNVQVGLFSITNDSWDYSCVPTQAGGSFSATLRWRRNQHSNQSWLIVSPASDNCTTTYGWDASVRISLVDPL